MELILAVSSVLGYNARFIFGREINVYDISLVLFFGVIAYGIVKYQAFNIKTAIHYSFFWFLSAITIIAPIIVFPLLFHNIFNNLSFSLFSSIYAISSIFYYIFNQNYIFPIIKKILFRRNKELSSVINSFRTDIENVNSIDSFKLKLSTLFTSILFSKNVNILLTDTKENIYINDATIDIKMFNWIHSDTIIINRTEIVDYAPKKSFFDSIHLIIKLNFNDLFFGYILLDEKHTLKSYNYEELNFIEQVLPSINTAIHRINILYKSHEIELVNQLKTSFFVNLAHDTKTPATLMLNYLNKCLSKYPNDNDLQIVKNNLEDLIRDMINFLDTEKIQQGRLSYDERKRFNLTKYLENKADFIEPTAEARGIDIKRIFPTDVEISTNIQAIDRILHNLLDNALRYTPRSGSISLELHPLNNEMINLIVSDTGTGIPIDKQAHIFEKYYQVSHDKGNTQGIGMGLFITKDIVENLGGTITFKSDTTGTSFTVTLPKGYTSETIDINDVVQNYQYISSTVEDQIYNTPFDPNKPTILLVEDNKDLMLLMKEYLATEYNVNCALNGKYALESLSTLQKPDIIVSDVMMDIMDGYEFLDNVRNNPLTGDIPFVFLTAKSGISEEIRGLTSGAIDYIQKPFSMDTLKARITSLLNYNALKRKIFELVKIPFSRYAYSGYLP